MKKIRTQLLATAAVVTLSGAAYAADMGHPLKAPPPAPIPYVGWQGFYVGGAIGAARLNTTATDTAITDSAAVCTDNFRAIASCSTSATGFTAGAQVGYDWQSRYFVYGVVADWTWTGLKHTVSRSRPNSGNTCLPFMTAKVDWLATFRGRMGLAVDDTLVYVTGGLALGHLKSSVGNQVCDSFNLCLTGVSTTRAGWVAGAGAEHKLTQNWSVFGEFLYYDFGHASASSTSLNGSNSYATEFTHEIFQGKIGLNYRF
jgi:outer membrane immunogenic protein